MEHEISMSIKKQIQNVYVVKPAEIEGLQESLKKIIIDVYLGEVHYKDAFLWDVLDDSNCPEVNLKTNFSIYFHLFIILVICLSNL